jgi:hypothetical protein
MFASDHLIMVTGIASNPRPRQDSEESEPNRKLATPVPLRRAFQGKLPKRDVKKFLARQQKAYRTPELGSLTEPGTSVSCKQKKA